VKINKILSLLSTAALLAASSSPAFSAAKRDVNDPVLREVINELSKKMPKFIDKYGETVFVEDEPITRGTLIQAIYEYDKRAGGAAAPASGEQQSGSLITRQEFDDLKSRVASLRKQQSAAPEKATIDTAAVMAEIQPNMPQLVDSSLKNSKVYKELQQQIANAKNAGGAVAPAKLDSAAIMAEVQPNMPQLLDASLKNSKVFKELQQQVASANAKNADAAVAPAKLDSAAIMAEVQPNMPQLLDASLKNSKVFKELQQQVSANAKSKGGSAATASITKDLDDINDRLDSLSQKVNSIDTGTLKASSSKSASPSQKEITELKNTLAQIQSNYVTLSKRIDDLDSKADFAGASSAASIKTGADVNNINRQLSEIKRTVADVPTTTDVRKEITKSQSQTQADIDRIEKKLNSMSKGTASSSSGSSSKSGATIATISLGITMLAALFVAR